MAVKGLIWNVNLDAVSDDSVAGLAPLTQRQRHMLEFSVALRPQRPSGTYSRYGEPRTATSTFTQLLSVLPFSVALCPQRPCGLLGTGSPGRPSLLPHSSWGLSVSPWVQCCFMSTETIKTVREPGRPPRLLHSSWALSVSPCAAVQCCFTSTETIRTIRDGEPRTATSTFTQLLNTECFTLFMFKVASRPQKP